MQRVGAVSVSPCVFCSWREAATECDLWLAWCPYVMLNHSIVGRTPNTSLWLRGHTFTTKRSCRGDPLFVNITLLFSIFIILFHLYYSSPPFLFLIFCYSSSLLFLSIFIIRRVCYFPSLLFFLIFIVLLHLYYYQSLLFSIFIIHLYLYYSQSLLFSSFIILPHLYYSQPLLFSSFILLLHLCYSQSLLFPIFYHSPSLFLYFLYLTYSSIHS